MPMGGYSNQNSASSTASASAALGDLLSTGGGGSRAPVYNTATGGSRLTADTGGTALDPMVWAMVAAGAFVVWQILKRRS